MNMKNAIFFTLILGLFLGRGCDCDNPTESKNQPPVITGLTADPSQVDLSGNSLLTCVANDPDGDNLTYHWTSISGSINGSGNSVTWSAPKFAGMYSIKCEVSDGKGGQDLDSINIEAKYMIPTDGLIAFFPFNGNANDESGNGYDGIVSGSDLAEDRFNNESSAFYFDGIDDYIEFNPQQSSTEFSVSAWFYMRSHAGWDNTIIAQDYSPSSRHITLLTKNDRIEWHRYNHTDNLPNIFSQTVIQDSIWYHVVITVHANIHKMYVDGVYEGTSTDDFQMISTMPLRIGRYNSGHYPFHGLIDDLIIYNRALTETEIQSLYNHGGWQK